MISVCIHAFTISHNGDIEYCDFDAGEVPSGWTVYTRKDYDDGEPFDIYDETDFPASDHIAAYSEACNRARKYDARVIRY